MIWPCKDGKQVETRAHHGSTSESENMKWKTRLEQEEYIGKLDTRREKT